MKKLTIYEALITKLGRNPTNAEVASEVKEILFDGPDEMKKLTIYDALIMKLGRKPTSVEVTSEVKRVVFDGLVEMVKKGKLPRR